MREWPSNSGAVTNTPHPPPPPPPTPREYPVCLTSGAMCKPEASSLAVAVARAQRVKLGTASAASAESPAKGRTETASAEPPANHRAAPPTRAQGQATLPQPTTHPRPHPARCIRQVLSVAAFERSSAASPAPTQLTTPYETRPNLVPPTRLEARASRKHPELAHHPAHDPTPRHPAHPPSWVVVVVVVVCVCGGGEEATRPKPASHTPASKRLLAARHTDGRADRWGDNGPRPMENEVYTYTHRHI